MRHEESEGVGRKERNREGKIGKKEVKRCL